MLWEVYPKENMSTAVDPRENILGAVDPKENMSEAVDPKKIMSVIVDPQENIPVALVVIPRLPLMFHHLPPLITVATISQQPGNQVCVAQLLSKTQHVRFQTPMSEAASQIIHLLRHNM